MKTIKIIDLLNKIANGEEVPKKIKVHNTEYHKCLLNTGVDYKIYSDDFYYLSNEICKAGFSLNDEAEIIEENKIPENKIPEKINLKLDDWTTPSQCDIELSKKIDEIIDYLESKEKGE